MSYDFRRAKEYRDVTSPFGGGVIPDGIYKLRAQIRPGGYGPERLLKVAKSGFTAMLVLELTVAEGKCAGAKFTDWITIEFEDTSIGGLDATQKEKFLAVTIGQAKLCDMLESAFAIDKNDKTPEAEAILNPQSLRVFDGLVFLAKVKVKPAENSFKESNAISYVLTPDSRGYYDPRPGKDNAKLPPPPFDDEVPF